MGLAGKFLGTPMASPASTCLPSPDAERQRLGTPEADDWEYAPLPRDTPGRGLLCRLPAGPAARVLGVAGLLSACLATLLLLSGERAPRLWDPDLRVEFRTEPYAKSVIRRFDGYNMARGGRDDPATFRANVELYMEPDLLYESVGFGTWSTPAGWARGEEHNYGMAFPETIFTQMLFFGDDHVATTTTYGKALWRGNLFGFPAPHQWVTLRITDFYLMSSLGRISYNFMMIDWADALRQVGRRMLPPAPLDEGLVLPPAANDGVPAPISAVVQAQRRDAAAARRVFEAALREDWAGGASAAAGSWNENMTFYGPGGIGLARGAAAYRRHVLAPFRTAFANRSVEVELSACEGNYCSAFGRIHGRGMASWLGLPTAGRDVALRFGMHWRVVGSKAQEGWAIFDIPGLFKQVGMDFYALAAAGGAHA